MWFDILVAAILLFSLLHGLIRGALVQVFKLAALVLVFIFGARLALPMGRWFLGFFETLARAETFCLVLAWVLLAGGALIVFSIAGHMVNKLVMKAGPLGWANRLAGAGLGLLKGLIVCYLLACVLSTVPEGVDRFRMASLRNARESSTFYRVVMEWSIFRRLRLQAAEVRYSLKEMYRLMRETPSKEVAELPAYAEAASDPVLGPLLTDEQLRATVVDLLDQGRLITLFDMPEVRPILSSPSKQLLLWKLIWQMREKHRAIVTATPVGPKVAAGSLEV